MFASFTRLACAGIVVAMVMPFAPGSPAAQSNAELLARLQRMQAQINDLERVVFTGDGGPARTEAPAAGNAPAPDLVIRLQQLESRMRELAGALDALRIDQRKLSEQIAGLSTGRDEGAPDPAASVPVAAAPEDAAPAVPARPAGVPGAARPGTLGYLSERDIQSAAQAGREGDETAPPADTADASYRNAFSLVMSHEYAAAARAFERFLDTHGEHPLAGTATYWLGETHYVRGDYRQAAVTFAKGYQNYPESPKKADNLLKLAMSLARLDRRDDACIALAELVTEFPNPSRVIARGAAAENRRLACDG